MATGRGGRTATLVTHLGCQFVVQDPSVPAGLTLSNGLLASTPEVLSDP